jgi:hypothetical protein
VKLPILKVLNPPVVLATGAAAVALAVAWRRIFRPYATTGGPIILMLANGKLLRAQRLVYPPSPAQRLSYAAIGMAPGAGPEEFATGWLTLSPDGNAFAISLIDMFPGGFDSIVAIHGTATGDSLFYGTDNTLAPPNLWSGDDPAAPAWLLAEQALRDADWQEWVQDEPSLPRPIVIGRFNDVSSDGEASPGNWTADGALLVFGSTRPSLTLGDENWEGDELEPWWAVVAPGTAGAWSIVARGHGALPASWVYVPSPPPVLAVAVDPDGRLLVDGVVQTNPMIDDAVVSVAGPFA